LGWFFIWGKRINFGVKRINFGVKKINFGVALNLFSYFCTDIEEPVYEFDFGPRFIPKFEKYPKGQVFNW